MFAIPWTMQSTLPTKNTAAAPHLFWWGFLPRLLRNNLQKLIRITLRNGTQQPLTSNTFIFQGFLIFLPCVSDPLALVGER